VDVGTLVGYMDIEDGDWKSGLASADRAMDSFTSSVDGDLDDLEASFRRADQEFADLMEQSFEELDEVVEQAFREAEAAASEGSKRIGKEIEQGVDHGMDGAKASARRGGEGAGEEFGGGMRRSGSAGAEGAGMDMMGALKGMGWAAVGAAIGAVLMDGFTQALDADKANAKLSAQLGATPEMAADFGGIAGRLYADAYGENIQDINTALKSVWQSGLVPEDESVEAIQHITATAMDFADAMDQDVEKAVRAAAKMIKTGLAEDGTQAFDILTRGMQQGANDADDLLDTFAEYPTMFRDLGLDGETAMGMLSQGLKAGARDADTVADALKEFAIRAQDGSKASAEGFKAIGMSAEEMTAKVARGGPEAAEALDQVLDGLRAMEDPVARNAAAVALFGTKAEDLGDALFSIDPSTAVAALGDVEGAAAKMSDTLHNNASAKIEAFKRGMEQNLVDFIGGNVLPALEDLIDGLQLSGAGDAIGEIVGKVRELIGGIVEDVRTWVSTHQEQIDQIVAKAQELKDKVVGYYTELIDTVSGLWESGGADWLDVVANHVEGLLKILGGLVDIAKGTFKTLAGFLTGDFDQMWSGLGDIASGGIELLKGILDVAIGNIVEACGGDWQSIKDGARDAFDGVVGFVRDVAAKIDAALEWARALPAKFQEWFGQAKEAAARKLDELVEWARSLPGKFIEALGELNTKVGEVFRSAMEAAKWALTEGTQWVIAEAIALPFQIIEALIGLGVMLGTWAYDAWEWVKTKSIEKIDEFLAWATELPGRIIESVSDFNDRVGTWASDAWQNAKDWAERKGSELIEWARGVPGRILESVSDLNDRVGRWARDAWQNAKDGASEKGNELVEWAKGLPGRIVEGIGDLGSKLLQAGKDIINGLLRGIKEAAQDVYDYAAGIADKIAALKGPLPYDRKLLVPAGQAIMQGLLGGLKSQESELFGWVSELGDRLSVAGSMTATLTPPAVDITKPDGGDANPWTGWPGDDPRGGGMTIGTFNAYDSQSPHEISENLDWLRKSRTGV
jgi:phage-related minor tail protein